MTSVAATVFVWSTTVLTRRNLNLRPPQNPTCIYLSYPSRYGIVILIVAIVLILVLRLLFARLYVASDDSYLAVVDGFAPLMQSRDTIACSQRPFASCRPLQ